jgi:hypothetical protein
MAERLLKDEYKTPLTMVRGVFLCDSMAVPVSVLTVGIDQEDWGADNVDLGVGTAGPSPWDGDMYFEL